MKPKKDRPESKYSVPHIDKLKNILNSNKEAEKAKDDKKRLKVFTSVCNRNASKKKAEEKTKAQVKEQSNERVKKTPDWNREDSKPKNLSRDRRGVKYLPNNDARSPDIRHRAKAQQNQVSQSFDNFNMEQRFYNEQKRQNYYNQNYMMNQSYNSGDFGGQQYYTQNQFQPMEHSSQGFSMTPNQYPRSAGGYYPDMRASTGYSAMQQSYRQGTRQFFPSNSQNRVNMSFGNTQSPDNLCIKGQNIPLSRAPINSKLKTGAQNFRSNNILRKKSKVIKISGVKPEMTPDLHHQLQKIGDIVELQMKWLARGDMQVKFKDEKSAREAMEVLDGMEMNGSKLQVTQVFHLLGFKRNLKMPFRQTPLGLIKESEDSDSGDPNSSNEEQTSYPATIEESEKENQEQIEKNINDLIDNTEDDDMDADNQNDQEDKESHEIDRFGAGARTQYVQP